MTKKSPSPILPYLFALAVFTFALYELRVSLPTFCLFLVGCHLALVDALFTHEYKTTSLKSLLSFTILYSCFELVMKALVTKFVFSSSLSHWSQSTTLVYVWLCQEILGYLSFIFDKNFKPLATDSRNLLREIYHILALWTINAIGLHRRFDLILNLVLIAFYRYMTTTRKHNVEKAMTLIISMTAMTRSLKVLNSFFIPFCLAAIEPLIELLPVPQVKISENKTSQVWCLLSFTVVGIIAITFVAKLSGAFSTMLHFLIINFTLRNSFLAIIWATLYYLLDKLITDIRTGDHYVFNSLFYIVALHSPLESLTAK